MSSREPIRGKVARILNSRELALNIGAREGVKLGMLFDVLDVKGEDIRDPDSDEVLGSLRRPKVRVRVTRVEERLSVASTFRSKKVNVGGQGDVAFGNIHKLFESPNWVRRYETLKTTEKTWEDLNEEDSFVRTGDPVIEVSPSEGSSEPGFEQFREGG